MTPIHFLFPSTDPYQLQDVHEACGCTGFDDEDIDCNEFEEEEAKINSEIVDTGVPYKEIEIIINDNRMVLRIQRLPSPPKEEYDPPCDCLPGSTPPKPSPTPSEPQRVITAAPIPLPPPTPASPPKPDKLSSPRPIDLAENPNMFLLRIRKRSETSDRKRENLDLEFRTPRPWLPKPPEKRKKSFREEYQEQKESQGITQDNGSPIKKKKSKKGKK